MAFEQIVNVVVAPETGAGISLDNLDVEFDVERSITFSQNKATVVVYNAAPDTVNDFLQKDNYISVEAGYADEVVGTIFQGQISFSSTVNNGVDRITTLEAVTVAGQGKPFDYNVVSLSYEAGAPLIKPFEEIASALGLVLLGAPNIGNLVFFNGFSFAGTVRQALRVLSKELQFSELDVYIDQATLAIYKIDEADSQFQAVVLKFKDELGPSTGLISVARTNEQFKKRTSKGQKSKPTGQDNETKRRIVFESILNPRIQPNGLVQIIKGDEEVDGVYIVEKVRFSGTNFGGKFNVRGEGSR